MVAELSFTEEIILRVVGPLVTVVLGGLAVGLYLRKQDAHRQSERNEAEARREAEKAGTEYRQSLAVEATEAAESLYLATQRYWRSGRRDADSKARADAEATDEIPTLSEERDVLDNQYARSRTLGEIIGVKLQALDGHEETRRSWHAVMDLLTVRYFQVTDRATLGLRRANAGDDHSGLDENQLASPALVLKAYRKRLRTGVVERLLAVESTHDEGQPH